MAKKENLADTLLVGAHQLLRPVIKGKKVVVRRKTEVNGRTQEIVEERTAFPLVSGTIRGFFGSLAIRKAINMYRGPPSSQDRNETPSNPSPNDVYDFRNNYLNRA